MGTKVAITHGSAPDGLLPRTIRMRKIERIPGGLEPARHVLVVEVIVHQDTECVANHTPTSNDALLIIAGYVTLFFYFADSCLR